MQRLQGQTGREAKVQDQMAIDSYGFLLPSSYQFTYTWEKLEQESSHYYTNDNSNNNNVSVGHYGNCICTL